MSDEALINNIIRLRESNDWSQAELARRIGMNNTALNKVEKGTRKLSSSELSAIANAFNVSTDYLLGRKTTSEQKIADLADDDTVFTYEGRQIPPEDLEYMKRLLRGGK